MKKFVNIFFVLGTLILFDSCSESKEEVKEPVVNAKTTLAIEGMMCEKGCKSTIQSHLREMNGVLQADVDYEGKKAVIEYDNRIVTSSEMIQMINELADGIYSSTLVEEKAYSPNSDAVNHNETEDTETMSVSNFDFTLPDFLGFFTDML